MTGSALITKSATMCIILGVAGGTIRGSALEIIIYVTTRAGNSRVFSIKVECKLRVIYVCRFPAGGRMTSCTICPELTLMVIILCVTGETILWGGFQVRQSVRVNMAG